MHINRLLTSPSASIQADLLIGAGLVDEVITSYIGFEYLGLAPSFRRAVESGQVRLIEADAPLITFGLQAAAAGQPFAIMPPGLELSDVPATSPDFYRWTTDPFTNVPVLAIPPLRPSVALIHCQEADEFGNALFKGSVFTDRLMAFAAERTIVQVENVLRTERLYGISTQVAIPAALTTAVVEEAFGCHPTSSHRYYNHDEQHLKDYIRLTATAEGMRGYLQRYVYEPTSAREYIERARADAPDTFTTPSL
ncbi:MAG: hypothetical protein DLM69_02065 [Candidatus Chloroheliales bacterium]|nr:MAG: hypothetical protein DLM69_02065 [Chloroflexota bacterium]